MGTLQTDESQTGCPWFVVTSSDVWWVAGAFLLFTTEDLAIGA